MIHSQAMEATGSMSATRFFEHVRAFEVPHPNHEHITPISIGLVRCVRRVGGLNLKVPAHRFAKTHGGCSYLVLYMP
jgi:hypothetical protein